jgi:hypothetical protein
MNSRLFVGVALFLSMMAAGPLARAQDSAAADIREVKAYRLTMPKVASTFAATKNLRKLAATDPQACAATDPAEGEEGKTLTERAKEIEASYPKVIPLLKAEGLTVREVLVLTMAQIQAGMAVYAKSMGMKELPAEVSPENVAFMEQHKKELDAMQAELKKIPDPCEDSDRGNDSGDQQ